MNHPFEGDTLIIIDIQAPNQLEILTCVRETFEFMPGWILTNSVFTSPTDARFFAFNLTLHTFEWWRENHTFSDTMDEDEVAIKDIADISHLLEFVWLNGEELRKNYIQAPPKKKRKKDDDEVYELSAAFEKFFGTPKTPFEKASEATEFIKIQPMNMPTGKVFYKDFVHKNTDISEALFEEFSKQIQKCNTASGLNGILNGLLGLHGPRVNELRHKIGKALDKIDAAECILGGMGLPYEATTKTKLSNLQSAHKSLGMKAEVDEYMSYLLQKKAQYTGEAYGHAYKECHKASKVWSKGWGYTPYPKNDGTMMVTAKPYSWSDVHPPDPMDY